MSVQDTLGVAALARILTELSQDEAPGVSALATRAGVSRTTAFEITRRLAMVGMVRRDIDGAVAAGPAAIALGFAAFRIAPLAGPAETLLSWLHERGDAFVELAVDQVSLVAFGKRQMDIALDVPVRDGSGAERARLRLAWRPHTNQMERQRISADFERVRLSLEQYLEKATHAE
jgi:DNA-binding IclR family transcriptional regulator